MEKRASLNSFGTFLETPSIQPVPSTPGTYRGDKTVGLLRALRHGPGRPTELMRETKMGVLEFAESLKTLQGISLVQLTGPTEDQVVELTKAGSQLLPQLIGEEAASE